MSNTEKQAEQQPDSGASPLFRKEALEYKKGSVLGRVVMITPISFTVWTIALVTVAVFLIAFIACGKYSKHRQAAGLIIPDKGLIQVYAKAPGVVVERYVKQGDHVVKDQPLYLISTEQRGLAAQGINAQMVASLEKQRELQQAKLESYKKNIVNYKKLLAKHYISEIEYQVYYDEYLNNEMRLKEVEKSLVEARSRGDHAVCAPEAGIVSAMIPVHGDHVSYDKPLATIIPDGAVLEGVLFVSTRDIGFVKVGQKVLLKYDAFPYQNFGLYESTVKSIDESVLSQKDLDLLMPPDPQAGGMDFYGNRTFYRVILKLKQSYVMVYGKPQELTAGMTMVGEIIGDRRSIWEWIFNPILTLKGSLVSA